MAWNFLKLKHQSIRPGCPLAWVFLVLRTDEKLEACLHVLFIPFALELCQHILAKVGNNIIPNFHNAITPWPVVKIQTCRFASTDLVVTLCSWTVWNDNWLTVHLC